MNSEVLTGIHFGFVDSTEVENKIEESEFEVYSEYHKFDQQVLKLELNIEFFFLRGSRLPEHNDYIYTKNKTLPSSETHCECRHRRNKDVCKGRVVFHFCEE